MIALALVVGCGAGLGAIAFRWLIQTFAGLLSGHADYSAAGHAGPEWLRPAVGGLLLGGLLLVLPQMYGVGYPVLENAIEGRYAIGLLLLLLVGKVVATSLTIGIGGSGGDAETGEPVGRLTHPTVLSALHAPVAPAGNP